MREEERGEEGWDEKTIKKGVSIRTITETGRRGEKLKRGRKEGRGGSEKEIILEEEDVWREEKLLRGGKMK